MGSSGKELDSKSNDYDHAIIKILELYIY